MNSQAQLSAAQQLASGAGGGMSNITSSGAGGADDDDDDIPELEAVEEDGNVDETGVDPKDIELVIQQVGCSRAKAVRVLKESGGDLINASEYLPLLQRGTRSLTGAPSHGCERVTLLCCIVSLPHCFVVPSCTQNLLSRLVDAPRTAPVRTQRHHGGTSLLPSTQLYKVIGSLPPVHYDFQAYRFIRWVHIPGDARFRRTSYAQAHFVCSFSNQVAQLSLSKHMIIPIQDLWWGHLRREISPGFCISLGYIFSSLF